MKGKGILGFGGSWQFLVKAWSAAQNNAIEEILKFNGSRMEIAAEATPHPNAQAYLST